MANKNLLQIVQEVCGRLALPIPGGVQSSTDPMIVQILGLLQEFLEDCDTRKLYQRNTVEATFVSTAAEDQGDINTICPNGFSGIVPGTFYDRTSKLAVPGAVTADEWQTRKALNVTGPLYQYRIRQNRLLFTPALPVAHTIALEYRSTFYILAANLTTYQRYWTLDTDSCVFPDALVLSWLRWKWKSEKGFDYAEDFARYERLQAAFISRDKSQGLPVNMAAGTANMSPGIVVPSGNWLQP